MNRFLIWLSATAAFALAAPLAAQSESREGKPSQPTKVVDPSQLSHQSDTRRNALPMSDRVQGVVALQITPRHPTELQQAMRELQWGSAWLQKWVLQQEQHPETLIRERLTWAMELAALTLEEKRFRSAATGFVSDMGCQPAP